MAGHFRGTLETSRGGMRAIAGGYTRRRGTGMNNLERQGGYAGQIVFHAKSGTVSVNQATSNVAKLPDVIKAVSPFASPNSGAVSKDGTIAYSSVSWSVNPNSLETDYLNRLDQAVA